MEGRSFTTKLRPRGVAGASPGFPERQAPCAAPARGGRLGVHAVFSSIVTDRPTTQLSGPVTRVQIDGRIGTRCGREHASDASPMPSNSGQEEWFAREVQPHEAELKAYLRRRFPGSLDVDDVVQESYLRLFRTRASTPLRAPKAYLFATARNVVLALFRRPKIFSPTPVTELDGSCILEKGSDVVEEVSKAQEVALLLEAIEALPSRCREIFILRKLQGLSQKEIAAQLGLSEQTVQVQIGRGARKCAEFLRARGVTGRYERPSNDAAGTE